MYVVLTDILSHFGPFSVFLEKIGIFLKKSCFLALQNLYFPIFVRKFSKKQNELLPRKIACTERHKGRQTDGQHHVQYNAITRVPMKNIYFHKNISLWTLNDPTYSKLTVHIKLSFKNNFFPITSYNFINLPEKTWALTPHLSGSSLNASRALFWTRSSTWSITSLPP